MSHGLKVLVDQVEKIEKFLEAAEICFRITIINLSTEPIRLLESFMRCQITQTKQLSKPKIV
jgi:hypothetical protein